jgi:hypothetical protein
LTKNKIAMVISKTIARIKATQIIIPKQYWTKSIQIKLIPIAIPKLINNTDIAVSASDYKLIFVVCINFYFIVESWGIQYEPRPSDCGSVG